MNNAITVTLVGGKKRDISDELISLQCTNEVNQVPSATIQMAAGNFADREYTLFKNSDFEVGKDLEIKARYEKEDSSDKTLFKGQVTARKLQSYQGTPLMVLQLNDPAFRLKEGVSTTLFSKKSDKQMIEAVLGKFPELSLKSPPGSLSSVQFSQYVMKDQSGWQFVSNRLKAHGLLMSFDNGSLTPWTPSDTQGETKVEVGIDEVLDFSIEENGRHLNQEVELSYWDVKKDALDPQNKKLPGKLAKEIKAPKSEYIEPGLSTKAEAEAMLIHFETRQKLEQYRGYFKVVGDPNVKVRQKLTIKGLPAPLNQSYVITGVTNKIHKGQWTTRINIGTRELANAGSNNLQRGQALDLQLATAKKWEKDPDGLGRVPIEVMGFGKDKYWVYPAQWAAGAKQRSFILPEEGERVIVGFMHGTYSQGVILTSVYIKDKLLKSPFKMDARSPVGLISNTNMQLLFDDDKKELTCTTPKSNTLTLNDQKGVTFSSKKDMKLSTNTKFDLKANATIKIKGQTIDLN